MNGIFNLEKRKDGLIYIYMKSEYSELGFSKERGEEEEVGSKSKTKKKGNGRIEGK